jgi:hypothetical protein
MTLNLESIKQPYFSCITSVGILTIDELDRETIQISLEDRFKMQITGKRDTTIQLDSDEKPTHLQINQTDTQWLRE